MTVLPPSCARRCAWLICVALSFLIASRSTSGQFTTVINVPPDAAPRSIDSDTQLNLFDGGVIGPTFRAGDFNGTSLNVEVNVFGGSVGPLFEAYAGSTVIISGGSIGNSFTANDRSTVNISGGSIGNSFTANDGSTVRISDGAVGGSFRAGSGSTVDISGGSVGDAFIAFGGSTVNISGGLVGSVFFADSGSTVNVSGGSVGDIFRAFNGSTAMFSGGEFRLDGILIGGLDMPGNTRAFDLPVNSVLSGTLADGTPFAFSSQDGDIIANSTLLAAALPAIGPPLITLPADPAPRGLRAGQTLVVEDGGRVEDHFNAGRGSTVNISGGNVGRNFEAVGAQITISGGAVGVTFDAFGGSTVNVSGGSIGAGFHAFGGSAVDIMGGSFGDGLRADSGSSVNLSGGEFRLDGTLLSGLDTPGASLAFNLPDDSVLSGTLADGTPFAISNQDGDEFADGTLTLTATVLPGMGPSLIMLPADPAPSGLRAGQTLVIQDGGSVGDNFVAAWKNTVEIFGGQVGENFEAVGAQVAITGGSVGNGFEVFRGSMVNISGDSSVGIMAANGGSTVNISGNSTVIGFDANSGSTVNVFGGSIVGGFNANNGSTVNVSGGSVGDYSNVNSGATVNISGGSVGELFSANFGSTVNVSGGLFGERFTASGGTVNISGGSFDRSVIVGAAGTVNVSGGSVDENFAALQSSEVNLFGTQFVLDGIDITATLTLNEPFTVFDRDVPLTGLLADGTMFDFNLNSSFVPGQDRFHPTAILTITLAPMRIEGDTNWDGVVDVDDLNNVRNNFGTTGSVDGSLTGDAWPFDGRVDIDDLNAVRNNFGRGPAPVPEPHGLVIALWLLAAAGTITGRRRRVSP